MVAGRDARCVSCFATSEAIANILAGYFFRQAPSQRSSQDLASQIAAFRARPTRITATHLARANRTGTPPGKKLPQDESLDFWGLAAHPLTGPAPAAKKTRSAPSKNVDV